MSLLKPTITLNSNELTNLFPNEESKLIYIDDKVTLDFSSVTFRTISDLNSFDNINPIVKVSISYDDIEKTYIKPLNNETWLNNLNDISFTSIDTNIINIKILDSIGTIFKCFIKVNILSKSIFDLDISLEKASFNAENTSVILRDKKTNKPLISILS